MSGGERGRDAARGAAASAAHHAVVRAVQEIRRVGNLEVPRWRGSGQERTVVTARNDRARV